MTGQILITGAGIVTLRLTETIDYAACGSFAAGNCSETYDVVINVEDGTAQNAEFSVDITNPCVGEVVTLTPMTPGGYFSGVGVNNNMPGVEGQFTPPSCGTYAVSYVLNSPNGCTAIYTLNITTDLTSPSITTPASDMTVNCDGTGKC